MFRRTLLTAAVLLLPTASYAQATVRGVAIGATCRLTDSRLNPDTPVTLAWDATIRGWKGSGNGMEYRLVYESDFDWFIRAVLISNGTVYNYGLAWQPSTQLRGLSPLTWTGNVPTSGPMWRAYGITEYYQDTRLSVTVTP